MSEQNHTHVDRQLIRLLHVLSEAIAMTDSVQAIQYLNPAAQNLIGAPFERVRHMTLADLARTAQLQVTLLPFDSETSSPVLYRLTPLPPTSPSQIEPVSPGLESPFSLAICDLLDIGVLTLDSGLLIRSMNDVIERLTGRQRQMMLGQPIHRLIPHINLEMLREGFGPNGQAQTFALDVHNRHLSGRLVPLLQGANNQQLLLSLFDAAPYQLHNAEQTNLLRLIIHDLTNPINIALNMASMVSRGELEDEDREQAAAIIVKQLRRMYDLLHDIGMLEELSEGIDQSFASVNFDIMVASTVNELVERAEEKSIHLWMAPLPANPVLVSGNERLLHQAVYNLIENAIKYTLPGGWVRVTLRQQSEWADVLIADNGIGVPPAKQPRVFTPFYRAKDPRMLHISGTGLGLNLVHMVAHQHKGKVWLHSVPDKGSIFIFRLPASPSMQG